MNIKSVAIVGAGIMGTDIALDLAGYGYTVLLKDLDENILEKAKAKIKRDFKMVKMMKKEMKEVSIDDILSRITFTTVYDGFDGVELVIENIVEEWAAKKALYLELGKICAADTIYAVNTSCISITKIGALMAAPEKIIGAHFMNPVPLKKIVEVIRGYHTSDETVETMNGFLKTLGKRGVVVQDFPGFVTNRVSHLFMNEAAFLVQDGVAGPKEVDTIFTLGFGHKMGPLATADLIGLDTVVKSLEVLYDSYQDSKFRCCPLLRKMVDAGLLGKKSGKGFFTY
ncbi:MAG: 3-hydroxyacyl-CoA dehydrogenase family protein [bacterium]|nr:3-hydroxyacyl-CoA dehydrogenase family protein [bacterium]